MALACGADLVLELPLPAALSSGDRFALGAVRVLSKLGGVEVLSFGSECGDTAALTRAAGALDSPAGKQALRRALAAGLSTPPPASRRWSRRRPAWASLLAGPNDLLGLSYVRAIARPARGLTPLAHPPPGSRA